MKLIKSVGIITLIAIVSKLLGFGRELLMAAYFGASTVTDAFFVASIIPVLMFTAVGMAITTGMAPLYAESKGKNEVISVLASMFFLLSVGLTIVFYLLTPVITKIMAPGFSEAENQLTNQLTVIMLPSFCFFVLSAIMTGILEYERVFAPPAFVAIPQNLFVILALIFLTNRYGIYGIAFATLLGAVSQFLIQYPFIKKYHILRVHFAFKKHKKQLVDTLKMFSPIVIASVAYQVNAVVDRMVASRLPAGSVSALNYANKLMFLPLSILLLSLITVLFPSIVDAAMSRGTEFVRLVLKGLSLISFAAIPILVVMLVESKLLVSLAFERGAFDETAARMTSLAFFFYSFGMVFIALKEFLNRCFVALKETKATMMSSVLSVVVNIVLSILLSLWMGVGGIALATSVAMALQTVLLFYRLPAAVRIEKTDLVAFSRGVVKLLILFLIVYGLTWFAAFLPINNSFLHLVFISIVAFVLFAVGAIILKCHEVLAFRQIIKSRRKD